MNTRVAARRTKPPPTAVSGGIDCRKSRCAVIISHKICNFFCGREKQFVVYGQAAPAPVNRIYFFSRIGLCNAEHGGPLICRKVLGFFCKLLAPFLRAAALIGIAVVFPSVKSRSTAEQIFRQQKHSVCFPVVCPVRVKHPPFDRHAVITAVGAEIDIAFGSIIIALARFDGFFRVAYLVCAELYCPARYKTQGQGALLLNIVFPECSTVDKLFSVIYQLLHISRDTCFILNFLFDIVGAVARLNLQGKVCPTDNGKVNVDFHCICRYGYHTDHHTKGQQDTEHLFFHSHYLRFDTAILCFAPNAAKRLTLIKSKAIHNKRYITIPSFKQYIINIFLLRNRLSVLFQITE